MDDDKIIYVLMITTLTVIVLILLTVGALLIGSALHFWFGVSIPVFTGLS